MHTIRIRLQNEFITSKKSMNVLGVIFDSKLNRQLHTNHAITKAKKHSLHWDFSGNTYLPMRWDPFWIQTFILYCKALSTCQNLLGKTHLFCVPVLRHQSGWGKVQNVHQFFVIILAYSQWSQFLFWCQSDQKKIQFIIKTFSISSETLDGAFLVLFIWRCRATC